MIVSPTFVCIYGYYYPFGPKNQVCALTDPGCQKQGITRYSNRNQAQTTEKPFKLVLRNLLDLL